MHEARRSLPEGALLPGTGDARVLLTLWYVRKSSYWIMGLGFAAAAAASESVTLSAGSDPNEYWAELHTPLAGVVLAILLRVSTSAAGFLVTFPLARDYEIGLSPRTNFGHALGVWLDRFKVMRAYRALRWTHHVREVALQRLGPTGSRVGRLDPILDVTNVVAWILAVIAVLASA